MLYRQSNLRKILAKIIVRIFSYPTANFCHQNCLPSHILNLLCHPLCSACAESLGISPFLSLPLPETNISTWNAAKLLYHLFHLLALSSLLNLCHWKIELPRQLSIFIVVFSIYPLTSYNLLLEYQWPRFEPNQGPKLIPYQSVWVSSSEIWISDHSRLITSQTLLFPQTIQFNFGRFKLMLIKFALWSTWVWFATHWLIAI